MTEMETKEMLRKRFTNLRDEFVAEREMMVSHCTPEGAKLFFPSLDKVIADLNADLAELDG